MESMGPIQMMSVAFPGNRFKGEILPELERLKKEEIVRVIDMLLVRNDHEMAAFRLPPCAPEAVELRLFREFRVEAPVHDWNGRPLLRVSIAAYNTPADVDRLEAALGAMF